MTRLPPLALVALPLALAACGPAKQTDQQNLDALDAQLTNTADANQPGKDPALMSALQSQIMVDPALAQQSNADTAKPGDQPYSAQVPAEDTATPDPGAPTSQGPLMKAPAAKGDCPQCKVANQAVTLGGLAVRQKTPRTAQCVNGIQYSTRWAARMPGAVPIYPQAKVIEAAGNAANGCALRVVNFTTGADIQAVLDWYYTKTTSAGYASEHQADGADHVLGGNRERDGAAFMLYASSRAGGGTDVDLIVNNGS